MKREKKRVACPSPRHKVLTRGFHNCLGSVSADPLGLVECADVQTVRGKSEEQAETKTESPQR